MTATQIPTPRTETLDRLTALSDLVSYMQALVFAGAIDNPDLPVEQQPSLRVWPDVNPAYTAEQLEARSDTTHPTGIDLINAINAAAAHLARA